MRLIQLAQVFLLVELSCGIDCTRQRCKLSGNSLRFLTVGDFGGMPVWPYYSLAEYEVAKGMRYVADHKQTQFQIALGDNFYTTGVKNVDDHRFHDTFEKVFDHHSLYTPWYVLAGNHDHYGNVSAEVAYTKKSQRWQFPSLYYTFRYELVDGTDVDTVMIDTVTLCGNNMDLQFAGGLWDYLKTKVGMWLGIRRSADQPEGPADLKAAADHWAWVENQLASSKAKYLFVAGHFPVYSISEHGPTSCLVDRLQPLLVKYKVSAYLDGHDHNLQHLQTTTGGTTVDYAVVGCGAYLDSSKKHEDDVPSGSLKYHYPKSGSLPGEFFNRGGFAYTELTSQAATFTFYKGGDNPDKLYTFRVPPRG